MLCHPQGLSWLLSVPGASGTVLEAVVPYSRAAMVDFLGAEPPKYVAAETAVQMAMQAYRRAVRTHASCEGGLCRSLSPGIDMPRLFWRAFLYSFLYPSAAAPGARVCC